jgi:hypothetical protein
VAASVVLVARCRAGPSSPARRRSAPPPASPVRHQQTIATNKRSTSAAAQRPPAAPQSAAQAASNPSIYQIGITENTKDRKEDWSGQGKNVDYWSEWLADSSADAKDIEAYFLHEKGMKGGTGGTITSQTRWVYVF